ncbi:ABC transporter permease [Allobranchiibius sp. GilTou38]|uniref:ABC transporter permease n=1 Tax=Allobranchiibius sp. GilTou38 TaxID=2815210 RepID=UPI001AA0B7AD|nr:ABC transporter permease [Allobranchiibius sp. GilTou38]MBO1766644.1 ABC transporter permease [Allobranchiibius sp. GilTou38]
MLGRLKFVPMRIVQAVPVAFGVTVVVFLLVHLIPGNPAESILGAQATPARVAALSKQMGLDESLPQQYLHFLDNIAHGNLGQSYTYQTSVLSLVLQRVPVTLLLVLYSVVLMLIISVPLSAWAASRPGGARDHAVRVVPLVGLGMPQFWVGVMLLLVFAVGFKWFPVGGYGQTFSQHLWYLFLPALTLAISVSPVIIRSLRSSMLNVLESDYVATARSKGAAGWSLFSGHVLRNAVIPAVSIVGVNVGYLVGGTLVIEQVFAIPGLGSLLIGSIQARDFPSVQAVALFVAVFVVAVGVLTDIVYTLLDPRVDLTRRGDV